MLTPLSRIMPRSVLTFVVASAILLFASQSQAQIQTGGATLGGGLRGGGGGLGSSGFGSSSFGASSFGASSFGGSNFGSSGLGSGGFGGAQSAFGGTNAGGVAPYVGRGGETVFVGRLSRQTNNSVRFNSTRQSSGGTSGDANAGASRRPPVRVRLRPSAELLAAARPAPRGANAPVGLPRMPGVTVRTRDGVTVLEGVVVTASQRLVAEKLASLEPGVGPIENHLRLQSEAVELVPPPR